MVTLLYCTRKPSQEALNTMGLCLCKCFKRDGRKVPESLYALSTSMDSSVKVYSWDRRPLESIEQCSCNGLVDSIKVFMPESMAGQQFTIENCQSCKIFVLDRTASIIIDDCQNCQIVLGPCSGSVFIRNSLDCRLWVLCQQFRIRDCRKLQVNLFCQSSPSLESSRSIEFACVQISYCQLDGECPRCNPLAFSCCYRCWIGHCVRNVA
ncbi:hypothetical protein M514_01899 [Trichuris suis]|uniref:C-CAP/cofactor C-like domain-containing protein n=1 Tax=Trichuris suis TaxID=68888 RepID=A0A085NTI3_9BILA|nr:hypothetical protein M513_01899 [Trichuris suis]KFD72779.1 hypothetical protein M514_01899 [Trichuris suis]